MRIAMPSNAFLPHGRAGTEHYLGELVPALADLGHEDEIRAEVWHTLPVSSHAEAYAITRGTHQGVANTAVTVPAHALDSPRNPRMRRVARELLAELRPDVMHVHNLRGLSLSVLDAAREAGLPLLLTCHDFWFLCPTAILIQGGGAACTGPEDAAKCAACLRMDHELHGRPGSPPGLAAVRARAAAFAEAFAAMDLVLYPSEFSRRIHAAWLPAPRRAVVSPLGMRPIERRDRPASGETLRLAYLGGVTHFKGLDVALDALLELGPDAPVTLDIHGTANNPDYLAAMLDAARGRPGIVHHGGYAKADLPDILAGADAVVLPSRVESYSFVAREALSAGVPVIASDAGALPEAVRHQADGLIFPSEDHHALAACIRRLLDGRGQDRGLLERLREGIRPVRGIEDDAAALAERYARLAGRV